MADVESEVEESDEEEKRDTKNDVVKMVIRKKIATTPISILVESLVRNLCALIETDEKRARKVYNHICDRLFKMNLIDESYRMTEFEGMRAQYEHALYRLVIAARGGEDIPHSLRTQTDQPHWSHYKREFEEVAHIAGGAFGQVYRVLHRLDGVEYAIKKIPIRSGGINTVMKYLDEVKTCANLNHPNVVQYKAAWLELGSPPTSTPVNALHPPSQNTSIQNGSTSNFEIEFERSTNSETSEAVLCRPVETLDDEENETNKPIWATLYIQMTLCQITLKNWLEHRNFPEVSSNINSALVKLTQGDAEIVKVILRQMLSGVTYIHEKGIVHHDIKPSNVFLQVKEGCMLLVQLGDFGLACPLKTAHHPLPIGTRLYAAPEQLAGKCDPKSDLFSLGIVLLELLVPFSTDMERVRTIADLRKGHLPVQLTVREPNLSHILSQLVIRRPQQRPTAQQLLVQLQDQSEEPTRLIQTLQKQLVQKDREINRLKALLRKAGIEIPDNNDSVKE